jgi:hypothetical protein
VDIVAALRALEEDEEGEDDDVELVVAELPQAAAVAARSVAAPAMAIRVNLAG